MTSLLGGNLDWRNADTDVDGDAAADAATAAAAAAAVAAAAAAAAGRVSRCITCLHVKGSALSHVLSLVLLLNQTQFEISWDVFSGEP